jgi:hypothetical protein
MTELSNQCHDLLATLWARQNSSLFLKVTLTRNQINFYPVFFVGNKYLPNAPLCRKHLIAEGAVTKECLIYLLAEVTAIFRKCSIKIIEFHCRERTKHA